MNDLETLLRATFTYHEGEAPPSDGLVAAARSRAARARRRGRVAAAGTSVLTLAVLVVGGLAVFGGSSEERVSTDPNPPPVTASAGWQAVSSLGVEVRVPPTWTINGEQCGAESTPTVDRELLVVATSLCVETAQITTVTIRAFSPGDLVPNNGLDRGPNYPHVLTLSQKISEGVSATFGRGLLPDGRTYLTVALPSIHVTVVAVGPDVALLTTVIATVRAVRVDNVGCTTALPEAPSWDRPADGPRIHVEVPTSVAVCYYHAKSTLAASARLTGAAAIAVSRAVNADQAGMVGSNLDCQAIAEVVIRIRLTYAAGAPTDLIAHYPGHCGNMYVVSQHGVSKLSAQFLRATVAPLHVAYQLYPGMPGSGQR